MCCSGCPTGSGESWRQWAQRCGWLPWLAPGDAVRMNVLGCNGCVPMELKKIKTERASV